MSLASEYTRFMAQARMRLPGALDSAIQHKTFSVLDEFFKDSNCWREEIRVSALTTKLAYEIESEETSATIVRLLKLVNGDDVPFACTMEVPGELVLDAYPQNAEYLYATVALTVNDPVPSSGDLEGYVKCPVWVFEKYRNGLLDGLIGRMMSQPAKPYTNERLAVYHMRRFRTALSVARSEAMHKNLYAAQAWRFPQSFSVRRSRGG